MKFSKFAQQFKPESGILQLMNDLDHAVNSGRPFHMLGGGNPAHIPEIEKLIQTEMLDVCNDMGRFTSMIGDYDGPQGNIAFIDALVDLFNEKYGWPITRNHIAITNGSQASFGMIFNLLAGEFKDGSRRQILLPITPEYIGYSDVGLGEESIFQARKPVIEIIEKQNAGFYKYHIDFENLNLDDSIGAVCVSRPTNPTGNVISDAELSQLSDLTKKAGCPLIIDGAYGLPFPGIIFNEATPHWDEHVILCLSLSKFGLPGVRTGIVIANPELINLLSGSNAIFSLAPGRIGPTVVTELVRSGEILEISRKVIKPYYRKRVDHAVAIVKDKMQDLPVRIHQPEGAIFLWLWFEGLPISSEELYQRLKKRGVLVIAGEHFFPGMEEPWRHKQECIRITYASHLESVEAGIQIIADEVRKAYEASSDFL